MPRKRNDRARAAGAKQAYGRNFVAEWAVNILVLLFASTSVAWAYVVPTGSMEKTVLAGDHIIVDKMAYARGGTFSRHLLPYEDPKAGDVIVFRYPGDLSQVFVKRVVGLPGDRIKLVNSDLYRNGRFIREPYVWHSGAFIDPVNADFPLAALVNLREPRSRIEGLQSEMLKNHVLGGEIVVPRDAYFAMGDNRDNSLDSRYWGFVPRQNIIGKPVFIYWSYEASENELSANSPTDVVNHALDLSTHFFTRTRWDRTFRVIRGYSEAP